MGDLSDLQRLGRLRFQDRSCGNCRYYREHETSAVVSECLLMGGTMGVASASEGYRLMEWARQRVCDLWVKRPKAWKIFSKGVDKNPHWEDPYLPRAMNQRRRVRVLYDLRQAAR